MVKVIKFGGTSLASAKMFQKVKDILSHKRGVKFVIASAVGKQTNDDTKLTDQLISIYQKYLREKDVSVDLNVIYARFDSIKRKLDIDFDIKGELDIITKKLNDHTASYGYFVSRGEYITAKLLAMYLQYNFVDAEDVFVFDNDTLNLSATKANLSKLKMTNTVIPGFYGCCNGDIKLFERGGSDVSASIVANLTGAALYENYTDTNGIYTADPKIIKNAKTILHLNYQDAMALSKYGATILQADTVQYVKEKAIPLVIKNTFDTRFLGTRIDDKKSKDFRYAVTKISKVYIYNRQFSTKNDNLLTTFKNANGYLTFSKTKFDNSPATLCDFITIVFADRYRRKILSCIDIPYDFIFLSGNVLHITTRVDDKNIYLKRLHSALFELDKKKRPSKC